MFIIMMLEERIYEAFSSLFFTKQAQLPVRQAPSHPNALSLSLVPLLSIDRYFWHGVL